MSILDKATLNRTGSQKRKYAKLEVFLKPTVGVEHTDMIQSIEEYKLELRAFSLFAANKGQPDRYSAAYEVAQKALLHLIYGDLIDLMSDLESALYNVDSDEMESIIHDMKKEMGI